MVLAGRRREALDELAAELGERCAVVTGDIADADAADALMAAADPVDILVNNAGITRDMLALRLKDADWQAVLDTNLERRLPAERAPRCEACSSGASAGSSTSPRSSASPAIRGRRTMPRPRPA